MGDISQGHPGVKQAVCIKKFFNNYFEVRLLEMVSIVEKDRQYYNPDLISVKNSKGVEWYFLRDRTDKLKYRSMRLFEDYFIIL